MEEKREEEGEREESREEKGKSTVERMSNEEERVQ